MARSQKEIWIEEHVKQETFTRIHSDKPSGPVPEFIKFVQEQGFVPDHTNVLDLGCGKGRNSIWVASQGFNVTGTDFAPQAIEEARKRIPGQLNNVHFEVIDLTEVWPYKDGSFQMIMDCNTTICVPNPGRRIAIEEAHRVLIPGGYYLFYGVARTPFVDKSPGPEPNSAIFPRTGKFEKQYTEEELRVAYSDFKTVSLDTITGTDIIEGKEIAYSMWVATFQK